jgi:hypothetical protein
MPHNRAPGGLCATVCATVASNYGRPLQKHAYPALDIAEGAAPRLNRNGGRSRLPAVWTEPFHESFEGRLLSFLHA